MLTLEKIIDIILVMKITKFENNILFNRYISDLDLKILMLPEYTDCYRNTGMFKYIIYNKTTKSVNRLYQTSSREALKIWMDLSGYTIKEVIIDENNIYCGILENKYVE